MKWYVRYILMNGDDLMLLRKFWLFGWREYQYHQDLINAEYEELNKLYHKAEKIKEKIDTLNAVAYREKRRIDNAPEHRKGYGPVLPDKVKLPFRPLRHTPTEVTDFSYTKLLGLLKGKGNRAEEIAGMAGVSITGINGNPVGGRSSTTDEDSPEEVAGVTEHPIERRRDRQSQRQKGNNSNNNPNY